MRRSVWNLTVALRTLYLLGLGFIVVRLFLFRLSNPIFGMEQARVPPLDGAGIANSTQGRFGGSIAVARGSSTRTSVSTRTI